MDAVFALLTNPFLLASLTSWFIAQILKVIISACIHKKLIWERLIGDGGMPSGHSATVSGLATYTALACGPGSFQFAMAAVFAIVVCHDAIGVRQETGKQALLLKGIIPLLDSEALPEIKLKELVGHTPLQVAAGVFLGLINGFILHYFI